MKSGVLLAIALSGMAAPAAAQQILGGATASVSLSIGIKGAERQPDVDFEVVQPDGQRANSTARAPENGERPGNASYPSDFSNAGMHTGTYRWIARVGGKVIASGMFKYLASKTGFQTYTP